MIRANNYTRGNIEVYSRYTEELEAYAEAVEGEEVSYTIPELSIEGLEECLEWLELDEATQELYQAIQYWTGNGYFTKLEQYAEEAENGCIDLIEGVTNDNQLAHYLMFDLNSDEDLLLSILGCSAEAYEQLGSYVSSDDLAITIDQECTVAYIGTNGYMKR